MSRDASPARAVETKKIHVYTVMRGEAYEGGDAKATFSNRDAAREYLAIEAKRYLESRADVATNMKQATDEWSCGCDMMYIEKCHVHDTVDEEREWMRRKLAKHARNFSPADN